jgi:membrane-associated phospholipid phosphatase
MITESRELPTAAPQRLHASQRNDSVIPRPALKTQATCHGLIFASIAFILAGFLALSVDTTLAMFFREHQNWEWKPIQITETFAHGSGVAFILVSIVWLAPDKIQFLPRLLTLSYGSGLLSNIGKVFLARHRPHSFDLSNSVFDSFKSWFPFFNDGYSPIPGEIETKWSTMQSFPSAHAATAFGLAVGLSYVFPKGRFYFYMLATFACLQRVVDRAHFPSDVLWGAALGLFVSYLVTAPRIWGDTFSRLESRLAERISKKSSS